MTKLIDIMMDKKSERKWEVESAMSTLQRAEEIRKDSKLMGDVRKAASAEAKKFQALASGGSAAPKKTLPRKKTLKRK
jgi:hypothetical protein|tara:strand:+ start:309 stop:542 length:234 start_codon:yes stop_codon:yes gene_type:complete